MTSLLCMALLLAGCTILFIILQSISSTIDDHIDKDEQKLEYDEDASSDIVEGRQLERIYTQLENSGNFDRIARSLRDNPVEKVYADNGSKTSSLYSDIRNTTHRILSIISNIKYSNTAYSLHTNSLIADLVEWIDHMSQISSDMQEELSSCYLQLSAVHSDDTIDSTTRGKDVNSRMKTESRSRQIRDHSTDSSDTNSLNNDTKVLQIHNKKNTSDIDICGKCQRRIAVSTELPSTKEKCSEIKKKQPRNGHRRKKHSSNGIYGGIYYSWMDSSVNRYLAVDWFLANNSACPWQWPLISPSHAVNNTNVYQHILQHMTASQVYLAWCGGEPEMNQVVGAEKLCCALHRVTDNSSHGGGSLKLLQVPCSQTLPIVCRKRRN